MKKTVKRVFAVAILITLMAMGAVQIYMPAKAQAAVSCGHYDCATAAQVMCDPACPGKARNLAANYWYAHCSRHNPC